jgi:hypothetical protein
MVKSSFIFILLLLTASFSGTVSGTISGAGSTGDKPQSKSWYAHGKWWCCLNGKIFKMENNQFVEVQTISSTPHVDALWNGTELFLINTSWSTQRFYKFTYNAVDDNYTLEGGFPITFSNSSGNSLGSPETIVMDQDSSGKIWVTFEYGTNIKVFWTESADHTTWNTQGYIVGAGVKDDDISTVTALPDGKIAVLWSNQNDTKVHFRMHLPGAPETTWTADELCNGSYYADDHMNFAVAPDGRVYVAVKTEGGGATHLLLERLTDGTWNQYPVSPGGGTRPNVMYNREKDEILYYYQTSEGTGYVVLYRVQGSAIVLDIPDTIIHNSDARDVSGTKQVLDSETGCLILAQKGSTSSSTVYFYYFDLDTGTTGVDQHGFNLTNNLSVNIFPNPFNSAATIKINYKLTNEDLKLQIFDIDGRIVYNIDKINRNAFTWTPNKLPSGIYFFKLKTKTQINIKPAARF